ncbi:hypothetical protein P153DRAFT_185076 [Dothidotthia symphoricarpi CBS 119687]|uniref:Uncharacterized protein n=1 Tax=Dothidotthia symphoricarpi CBS 119687 TaxID=1392245 RepID=A0A6A6AJJ3_9PLEO|nr:uncharacterized protein P153DRAFT_185076 [Dothidotthia symphoricarpi CBS 119687]KAF2132142.1 hypothetical protein P153DRAFT_185076 [Dothidotthia symphoricarpi CBS 119687]
MHHREDLRCAHGRPFMRSKLTINSLTHVGSFYSPVFKATKTCWVQISSSSVLVHGLSGRPDRRGAPPMRNWCCRQGSTHSANSVMLGLLSLQRFLVSYACSRSGVSRTVREFSHSDEGAASFKITRKRGPANQQDLGPSANNTFPFQNL